MSMRSYPQISYGLYIKQGELEDAASKEGLEEDDFVDTDDIVGYDFTDKVSRQSFQRQPMISIEWSAMIALAYLRVGSYFAQLADLMNDQAVSQEAVTMSNKAAVIVQNLDQKAIMRGHQQMVYPYATKAWEQVFPFAPWWRTPQRGEGSP